MRYVMRKVIFCGLFWMLLIWGAAVVYAQQSGEVLTLQMEGPVTPAMASYFERGIETAEQEEAAAVLILLNTPGGNLEPTSQIVQLFRTADVPVIVYVSPRGAQAASAGSIITMAAHASAMAPESVIGAASPVGEGGAELDETISRKLIEDLKAQARTLTERRGAEAVALAEAMIEEARAVHAQEALDAGLIDVVADDTTTLLAQLDGKTVLVNGQPIVLETAGAAQRDFSTTFIEQALHALSNPVLISILLALAVPAILIEISNPGGWVAGFIGVLCLGLGLYGLGQLPANWLGLGLVAIAFVLFVLEVKALTHGALAVTGTATLLAGFLVLFNSPGTPDFARISIPSAVAISLSTAAFFIFLLTMALRAQKAPAATGVEGIIGQTGTVRQALTSAKDIPPYAGMVFVMGALWRAEADKPVEKGEEVVVTAVDGFTLRVRKGGSGEWVVESG
jgi:membrane-bound serine protease (ClpP class)